MNKKETKSLNIVLLEHRIDYRAIYGMNFSLYLGANILTAKTIKESMNFISEHDVDLIFVNNDAYGQDVALELYLQMEKEQLIVPLYILGTTKLYIETAQRFDSNVQIRNVLKSIAQNSSITAKMMADIDHPLYFPLEIEFIIPGWQTITELFMKKNDNYEAVFSADEIIFAEQLEDLKKEGCEQLFVDRDKRLKFVNSLTMQISAKLNNANLSTEERIEQTEVAYQMVMEQARQLGIADSTMDLANTCISSMKTIVETIPTLESLLQNLLSQPGSYRYKQSMLISFIGSHIIKKTKYPNKEQQEIFAFVSFFHNIALNKDEYAMIHTDKQLEESGLSDKEKKIISKHAIFAAKLVTDSEKAIPYEAGIILKQHHGSGRGLGLSNLSANISHLAMVFIFAQEWANIILSYEFEDERPTKKQVIEMLNKKYDLPGFKKLLPILHTLEL